MKSIPAGTLFSASVATATLNAQMTEYSCYVCRASIEHARVIKENSIITACQDLFGSEGSYICEDISMLSGNYALMNEHMNDNWDARDICVDRNVCISLENETWRGATTAQELENTNSTPPSPIQKPFVDIRVSKAYGSKGYDKVRISAISNRKIETDFFTYYKPFQYRWTNYFLNTGIVTVTPGKKSVFRILNETVSIHIPLEDKPTRGIIYADPCYSNDFVWCTYGTKFNTYNRSIELLNTINAKEDEIDFWMILGDNFYDQKGEITTQWFTQLSTQTKSKVYASVPGNHDFWILSAPVVWMPKHDQLGYGFLQHNAQDVAASLSPTVETDAPYDFKVNPDAENATSYSIPSVDNFFSYYKMGNIGFISYSGAHTLEETTPYFEEACEFMTNNDPSAVLLLGHWNTKGLGCTNDMNVPDTYREIIETIPKCNTHHMKEKLRYIMGHMHCNVVVEDDVGFMVAGQGMTSSAPCGGGYGLPIVDTHGGMFNIYYFDIQADREDEKYDNYDAILDCIKENGVSQCYHLAKLWTTKPLY